MLLKHCRGDRLAKTEENRHHSAVSALGISSFQDTSSALSKPKYITFMQSTFLCLIEIENVNIVTRYRHVKSAPNNKNSPNRSTEFHQVIQLMYFVISVVLCRSNHPLAPEVVATDDVSASSSLPRHIRFKNSSFNVSQCN